MNSRWFPDPIEPSRIRLHDGVDWTERTQSTVSDTHLPTEAGWYPDPINIERSRYFDGSAWTDEVQAATPPASSLPSTAQGPPPAQAPASPNPVVAAIPAAATPNAKDRFLDWRLLAAITVAGVVGATLVGWLVYAAVDRGARSSSLADAQTTMPSVDGLLVVEARELVLDAGLIPSFEPPEGACAGGFADWQVTFSNPGSGEEVPRGSPARLTVTCTSGESPAQASAGPPTSTPSPDQDVSTSQDLPPVLSVEQMSASTEMWKVTWETVTAENLQDSVATEINEQLDSFTNSEATSLLAPPLDAEEYESLPGSYEHTIDIVPCPQPFLCLVKRVGVFPPGGGSGFGVLETLVIDYQTGGRLEIDDVVRKSDIPGVIAAANAAVAATGEGYEGTDLLESLDQLSAFVPQDDGLLLYFSEYVVGPFPVEVFVSWDAITGTRSAAESGGVNVADAFRFVCASNPNTKPDLVGANSDAYATAVVQVLLKRQFGLEPGPIDGQYGPKTVAAVKRMQAFLGVVVDGQVGPITWTAIQRAVCPLD